MARMTNQKKILYGEAKQLKSLFDAYKLHANARKKDERIGIATTYRFLNSLESKGEIHSFICDGRRVYSNDKISHAEFKCENCGVSKHINVRDLSFLKGITDSHVCHFQIAIMGLCHKCEEKS